MPLVFSKVEKHVLVHTGGFSRQLVQYWEKAGAVPTKHIFAVHDLLGRPLEELLGQKNGSGGRRKSLRVAQR